MEKRNTLSGICASLWLNFKRSYHKSRLRYTLKLLRIRQKEAVDYFERNKEYFITHEGKFDLGVFLQLHPQAGIHKIYGRLSCGGSYFNPQNFVPICGEDQLRYLTYHSPSFLDGFAIESWEYPVYASLETKEVWAMDLRGMQKINSLKRWGFAWRRI